MKLHGSLSVIPARPALRARGTGGGLGSEGQGGAGPDDQRWHRWDLAAQISPDGRENGPLPEKIGGSRGV